MIPGAKDIFGELFVTTVAPSASTVRNAGIAMTPEGGAVHISFTDPVNFVDGLGVTALGQLCVVYGGPVANYMSGLPRSSTGRIVGQLDVMPNVLDPYLNKLRVGAAGVFMSDGNPDPFATSKFFADLSHTAILVRGVGVPTFARNLVAPTVDFEGRSVQCLANEIRFLGARRVRNLCPTPSTSIAVSGNKTITVGVGVFIFSMGAEATGTSLITFTGTATGSTGTLTASASGRVSKVLTITVGGTIIATCTTAVAVDIQFEDITGRTDQTTPSEYVSVGVLSAPFHGAGVDGVKYFNTLNGNTVVNNVVIEAVGPPINSSQGACAGGVSAGVVDADGPVGYLSEKASTNLSLQSNTFLNAPWVGTGTPTAVQNATGANGQPNYAWTMTDDNGGATESYQQNTALTAAVHTISALVKKTVGGQPSYPLLFAVSGTVGALGTIDTSIGLVTPFTSFPGYTIAAGLVGRCSHFNSEFWLAQMSFTADATTWTTALIPAATSNPTQSSGSLDPSVTGSVVMSDFQVELGTFATSRITTTNTPVTRPVDLLQYPVANLPAPAADETWYCEASQLTPVIGALMDTNVNYRALFVEGHGARRPYSYHDTAASGPAYGLSGLVGRGVSKVAMRKAGNTINAAIAGVVGLPITMITQPAAPTGFSFGVTPNGTNPSSAAIRNAHIWDVALTDVEMGGITSGGGVPL